jgi:hypothetical protein
MRTANDYQWCFRVLDDNQFDFEFYGPMSKSEANKMFRAYESNGAYGLGFGFKTTPIGRGDIARAYRNKRLKELQGEHRARALKCVGMDTKIFSSEMAQIFMDKYLTVLEKGAQDAKSDGVKDLLSNMIRACKTAKLKTTATGSGYHIVFPLGTEMKIMAKEHLLIEASGGEKEHRGALLLNLDPETIRENQLIWSKETFDLYLYTGKAEAAKVRATKRLKTASTMPEELKSQRFAASNIRWETLPSGKVLTYDDGIDLWSIRPKMGGWFVSVLLEEGTPLKSTKMHDLIQDAQMEAERRIRAPFDNLAGMSKFAADRKLVSMIDNGSRRASNIVASTRNWTRGEVTIVLRKDQPPMDPIPGMILGVWSVIKPFKSWNVTHVPSGLALVDVKTKGEGIALVESIIDQFPHLIDATESEVLSHSKQILPIVKAIRKPLVRDLISGIETILRENGLRKLNYDGGYHGKSGIFYGIPKKTFAIAVGARDIMLNQYVIIPSYSREQTRWNMADSMSIKSATEENLLKWVNKVKNAPTTDEVRKSQYGNRYAKNLPKDVERYVKEHKAQGNDEGKSWALAWSRYCQYKNPDSPHCKQDEYFKGRKGAISTASQLYKLLLEAAESARVDKNSQQFKIAVKQADIFEEEVRRGLSDWVKDNVDSFHAKYKGNVKNIVDKFMEFRGNEAPFVYFTELGEGGSRSNRFGKWRGFFNNPNKIEILSRFMENHLRNPFRDLNEALTDVAKAGSDLDSESDSESGSSSRNTRDKEDDGDGGDDGGSARDEEGPRGTSVDVSEDEDFFWNLFF